VIKKLEENLQERFHSEEVGHKKKGLTGMPVKPLPR
jgi:hypothetical protein